MSKKQCLLLIWVLVASASVHAADPDPDLFAWWKLDEGSGTIASDASGNGIDAALTGNPKWVNGVVDGALELDGVDEEGKTGRRDHLVNWTLAFWVNSPAAPASGDPVGPINCQTNYQINWNHSTDIYVGTIMSNIGGAWYAVKFLPIEANTWYHIVGTYDGSTLKAYRDGVLIESEAVSGTPGQAVAGRELLLGGASAGRYFAGTLDDVRIYSRALTEEEIQELMVGTPIASQPSPANKATDVPLDVVLSWAPVEDIDQHDVYFGTDFDDVNDATPAADPQNVYQGRQTLNQYPVSGLLDLDFGQTYYWRVDEVGPPPDSILYKGSVWQFSVERLAYPIAAESITATASSTNSVDEGPENTVNGSGLDADDLHSTDQGDMWLSDAADANTAWIQYEFDRVYELHQMWVWNHNTLLEPSFGLGIKEATIEYSVDGADWMVLETTHEFAQGSGAAGYAANSPVDLSTLAAKYIKITANSNWGGVANQFGLSEVRFSCIPVQAGEPNPAVGSLDVAVDNVALSWRSGRKAATHEVYLSIDEQAVIDETISPASVPAGSSYASYETGGLDVDRTYYWKVNEVNEAASATPWQGDVWNFTTQAYLVVEDFEQYDDTDHRIFDAWADYFVNNTGATVGHFDPPFAEQTIVHDGAQSMPYRYDNDGVVNEGTELEKAGTALYSEAEYEWTGAQDWTTNGVDVLTVWFKGLPPLYGSFMAGPPMTMTARGAGISGASDQLHFAYKPLSGDGSIIAKVDSLTDTGASAAAGVMIRESLAANAMHATVVISPTSGLAFISRTKTGGTSTTSTVEAGITAPQWVRLTRTGRDFTAEYSANGTTWTMLGEPVSIAMSSSAYVGLSLTAGTAAATCTTEFSNAGILGSAAGQWQSQDIGIASNAAEPLYVALQDSANHSAVVPYPEPAATTIDAWTEWNIPLAEFTGVNPQAVKKISIGIGDRAASQPGGSGTMYFDDIRLRPSRTLPQDPDLIGYYRLDGDAKDGSGNSYHGTVKGGEPQWVDGIIDGALELATGNYVSTGNKEQLVYWTAACWVKSPEAPKSGPYGGLINRQGNYQVNWNHSTEIYRGGAAVNVGGFQAASFGPVEADTWYHIAATYDGNVLKAYKDGILITSTEAPGVPGKASRDLRLGLGFAGTLDDVRVYRRALSETEIANLADMGLVP